MAKEVILLVITDKLVRKEVWIDLLKKRGFEIDITSTLKEALEKIKKGIYTLVLLEVRLAALNNFAFLKKIKNTYPNLIVVTLTTLSTIRDGLQSIKFGAFDFVINPPDFEQYEIVVDKLINIKSLLTELISLKEKNKKREVKENSNDTYSLEEILNLKFKNFVEKMEGVKAEDLHSMVMEKVEKLLISSILNKTEGNQVKCAKILGIARNTLRKKIKALQIPSPNQ